MNAKVVINQEGLIGWSSRLVIRSSWPGSCIWSSWDYYLIKTDNSLHQGSFHSHVVSIGFRTCPAKGNDSHCIVQTCSCNLQSQARLQAAMPSTQLNSLKIMCISVTCTCRHCSRLNKSLAMMLLQATAADDCLPRYAVKSGEMLCNNHHQNTYQEGVTALNPGKRRCACNAGHSA